MMGSFTLRAGVVRPLERKPERTDAWRDVHKVIGKHQIGSFHKFTEQAATAVSSASGKRKAATPLSAPSSTPRRKVPDLVSLPTKTPKRGKQVAAKVAAEPPPVDVGIARAADAIDMWADLEDLFDPRLFASDLPTDAGPIVA